MNHVTEAVENYLETILTLSAQRGTVRATDICAEMGYSRPTVSIAVKAMKQSALIEVDDHNLITLTPEGRRIAEEIYERHTVLSQALMYLGVDKETALQDACKMEHDISDVSFACIKRFINTANDMPKN